MKTFSSTYGIILPLLASLLFFSFLSCKKAMLTKTSANEIETRKRPPTTTPQPLYFNNCGNPGFSGGFAMGQPANVTITLNYVNGSGASYSGFTSATVNGITIIAPSGRLNSGAGAIIFTATGTPVATGYFTIPVRIAGSSTCNFQITVLNPLITVSTGDPGLVAGSTGTVSFNYQNQPVTYKTVRALDGKIWIQQNLGSPQVASHSIDDASYGHFFQWGRWADGHQLLNSTSITGSASLQNPAQLGQGNPNFIKSEVPTSAWWGQGGLSTDTWSGNIASSTNGKDPCSALGAGWRMPSAVDWQNVINLEGISDTYNAYRSNLKLPAGGIRFSTNGVVHFIGDIGYAWTSTADGDKAKSVFISNAYGLFISPTERGVALPCRCVKD